MTIATALNEELHRLGITHEKLARMTHYSRQSVTAWANGRRSLPDDAREQLAKLSPRLALEIAAEDPVNIFLSGWLDGEIVDLSILGTKTKLAEELEEAAAGLRELNLVNKCRPEHLTDEDRRRIHTTIQELLDLMTCIPVFLVNISEKHELNLHHEIRAHRRKLVGCGYKKKAA